jgi:glutamine synthetase adenylyltransferase
MNIFHVACRNHCLNLGCKDMEMSCPQLKEIADKTQEIHRKIKASNKLSAVLENVQASSRALDETVSAGKLKLSAATRWNSLEAMLDSHKKSVDSIRTVIELHPERDLSDETVSNGFMKELNKHLKYLGPLKSASVRMQKYLATLDDCQFQCDVIAELAKDGYGTRGHDFQHCK